MLLVASFLMFIVARSSLTSISLLTSLTNFFYFGFKWHTFQWFHGMENNRTSSNIPKCQTVTNWFILLCVSGNLDRLNLISFFKYRPICANHTAAFAYCKSDQKWHKNNYPNSSLNSWQTRHTVNAGVCVVVGNTVCSNLYRRKNQTTYWKNLNGKEILRCGNCKQLYLEMINYFLCVFKNKKTEMDYNAKF